METNDEGFDAIKNEGEECSNFSWKENFVGVAWIRKWGFNFFEMMRKLCKKFYKS